jgi:flavin-dependent thymidylate synthase
MTEVSKWADKAMYEGEPHVYEDEYGVLPKVFILQMPSDPLGSIAAKCMMYEGKVVRDLGKVTDDQRRHYFDQVQKTHLQGPLEAVDIHFLFEGVDRGFTHQLVRERIASYAQESHRFTVIGDLARAVTLPPSLHGTQPYDDHQGMPSTKQAQRWRDRWDRTMDYIAREYEALVSDGMPQEDARGLLPTATATRIHQVVDLRTLSHHAGNRLCTQAQFHWRDVYRQIIDEIRNYPIRGGQGKVLPFFDWQFEYIAESPLFRPACYQLNRCPFKASFDRACRIRSRVEMFGQYGIGSEHWDGDSDYVVTAADGTPLPAIRHEEWLEDPDAARERA